MSKKEQNEKSTKVDKAKFKGKFGKLKNNKFYQWNKDKIDKFKGTKFYDWNKIFILDKVHRLDRWWRHISIAKKFVSVLIVLAVFWFQSFVAQIVAIAEKLIKYSDFEMNPFVSEFRFLFLGPDPFFISFLVVFFGLILYAFWFMRNHVHTPRTRRIFRNGLPIDIVVNDGSIATDSEMDLPRMEKAFEMLEMEEYQKKGNIIFGKYDDNDNELVATLRPNTDGRVNNCNTINFGFAGSGKTSCFIFPMLFQLAKSGDNIIVTDPSGEIFENTYGLFKKYKYSIKIINPEFSEKSNTWNFVGEIGNDSEKASKFANTIILNTNGGGEGDDYWSNNADNILYAFLLLVNSDAYKKEHGENSNTLQEIVNILNTNSVAEIDNLFALLEGNERGEGFNPAYLAYQAFKNSDKNQAVILNNLAIRLRIFMNPEKARIVSENDIQIKDLVEKNKQIIYLMPDELDDTFSLISALFVDACFSGVSAYQKINDIINFNIHFVFDEFLNIGKINECGKKLATARKYHIVMHLICQSYLQLLANNNYGKDEGSIIFANCAYKMCFQSGDDATSKIFSDMSGTMSVLTYQRSTDAPIANTISTLRTTVQSRPIFDTGEISHMDSRKFLILTSTGVAQLDKFFYKDLEEYKMLSDEERTTKFRDYQKPKIEKTAQNGEQEAQDNSKQQSTPKTPKTNKTNKTNNKPEQQGEPKQKAKETPKKNDNKGKGKANDKAQQPETSPDLDLDKLFNKGKEINSPNSKNAEKGQKNEKEGNMKNKPKKKEQKSEEKATDFDFVGKKDNHMYNYNEELTIDNGMDKKIRNCQGSLYYNLSEANVLPKTPEQEQSWEEAEYYYGDIVDTNGTDKVFATVNRGKVIQLLSFKSNDIEVDNELPFIQLRIEGEKIDFDKITSQIHLKNGYEITKWVIRGIGKTKFKDTEIDANAVFSMPKAHVMAVPMLEKVG